MKISCWELKCGLREVPLHEKLPYLTRFRQHIDECRNCWDMLVATRWDVAAETIDVAELKEYLDERFEWGLDSSWLLANQWNSKDRATPDHDSEFYRSTPWYVYNLVLWEASGQRPAYVDSVQSVLRLHGVASVLDFGAGVGNDALKFSSMGLEVSAWEFDNESSRFLRWRAARRALRVRYLNAEDPSRLISSFDLLWAMDVVEHLRDPADALGLLLERCRLLVYDTEHAGASGGRHPFHFQHNSEDLAALWQSRGFGYDKACSDRSGLNVFSRTLCF